MTEPAPETCAALLMFDRDFPETEGQRCALPHGHAGFHSVGAPKYREDVMARAMDLARAVQDASIRPDELQEFAGLVLLLLTCQRCDEPADFRRCGPHR